MRWIIVLSCYKIETYILNGRARLVGIAQRYAFQATAFGGDGSGCLLLLESRLTTHRWFHIFRPLFSPVWPWARTNKQQQSKSSVRGLADSKQPWPRLTTRL